MVTGGPQPYPLVPGYEIVGIVTPVGTETSKYKVGDRVAVAASNLPYRFVIDMAHPT